VKNAGSGELKGSNCTERCYVCLVKTLRFVQLIQRVGFSAFWEAPGVAFCPRAD
jgi:hypothetical protein